MASPTEDGGVPHGLGVVCPDAGWVGCWVGGRQHAGKFSQTKVACRREGARDRGVSTAERFISLRDRQIIMRQERRRLFVFCFFFFGN